MSNICEFVKDVLIETEFAACTEVVYPVGQVFADFKQVEIVPVLYIAFTVDLDPVLKLLIPQVEAGMQPLEQNGMFVLKEPVEHCLRPTAGYYIRFHAQGRNEAGLAWVIMNFFTVPFKFFFSPTPARVFNTVQMNFYSLLI